MKSFLSQLPAKKTDFLARDYLLAKLGEYFHAKPPPDVVDTDYTIWRCEETGLEFCDPPIAGDNQFYRWVSSFKSYYPGHRWEYGKVAELIRFEAGSKSDFKVLDVGSGSGDFLKSLDFIAKNLKTALDLNESAIDACKKSGIKAFCSTVEDAINQGFFQEGEFSVVTSFHCLEHISDPVSFVKELLKAIKPGGKLFLSTPYSPMSFESEWFDVMNHPPHHMTRWTLKAYQKLAELCKVEMRFHIPNISTFKQALQTFRLVKYGANKSTNALELGVALFFELPAFLRFWKQSSMRAKLSGVGGSDLILVEYTAP